MKIFITGGTGFIGSHLINELSKFDYDLICLRRQNSDTRIPLKKEPQWINEDINLDNIEFLRGVDVVINIAAVGVSPQISSWEEMERININLARNLLLMAIKSGVKRFIAIGSSFEYGNEANFWEKIPPYASLNPVSLYGISKAASFFLLNEIAQKSNIEFFYSRVFTAYGKGQFSGNLYPELEKAALKGEDFILKKPNLIRDFISIKDVIKHLRIAINRKDINSFKPKIVNIGSGEGLSIYEFASKKWSSLNATGKLKLIESKSKNFELPKMVADLKGLNY